MLIKKSDFARLAGVNPSYITNMVTARKLIAESNGDIDTDNIINKNFIENRKKKKSKSITARAPKLDGDDLEPADSLPDIADDIGSSYEDDLEEMQGISDAEKRASIRLKLSQARRHELKLEQDKKTLIQIEIVQRSATMLGQEIRSRIQDLPKRIAPRLLAMAESGSGEREIRELMEKEIDDALEAVRRAVEGIGNAK